VNHPDVDPSAILWWIVDGRDSNFSDTVPGDWQISVHPAAWGSTIHSFTGTGSADEAGLRASTAVQRCRKTFRCRPRARRSWL